MGAPCLVVGLWSLWLGCAAPPEGAPPGPPGPPIEGQPVSVSVLAVGLEHAGREQAARCFLGGDWACAEAWVEHLQHAEPSHASPHAAFFGLLSRAPESPTIPLRELVALDRAIAGLVDPSRIELGSLPRCGADCRGLAEGYLQTVSRIGNPTPGFAPRAGVWLARSRWGPAAAGPAPAPEAVPGGLIRRSHPGAAWAWGLPAEVEELVSGHGVVALRLAGPDAVVVLIDAVEGHVRAARSVVGSVARGGLALPPPSDRALAITPEGLVVGGPEAAILLEPRAGVPTARLPALPDDPGEPPTVQLVEGGEGPLLVRLGG